MHYRVNIDNGSHTHTHNAIKCNIAIIRHEEFLRSSSCCNWSKKNVLQK